MSEPLYVIRWQSPPDPKRPGGPGRPGNMFAEVADHLREKPGRWGVVFEGVRNQGSAMASHISNGVYPCFRPPGSFEARARMDRGVRTVYARYIGQETS